MVKLQNRKETAQECNLPYEYKTMRSAVIAHFKHLKELGQNPAISIISVVHLCKSKINKLTTTNLK
jgi:hypothetical protein